MKRIDLDWFIGCYEREQDWWESGCVDPDEPSPLATFTGMPYRPGEKRERECDERQA